MAKWDNPIGIPFAESGDRTAIPDTSENGDVNNTTGFGNKYEIDPAVGGLWLYRQTMNSLFHSMFSSIKEIQTKVPVSVNGIAPDVSGNISISIPVADGAGIKIIDDNSPDITSFNQLTEDGIYYIYKQLSDGPSYEGASLPYKSLNLTVINVKQEENNLNMYIQLTSINIDGYGYYPSNIGHIPMVRTYDKNTQQWGDWYFRCGILFSKNNILIDNFTMADKLDIKFPIIAQDTSDSNIDYNTFMYSATKEQMREQLGIKDPEGNVEKWNTYTHFAYVLSTYTNTYNNISYCLFNKNINNTEYKMIKIQCMLSYSATRASGSADLKVPLPQNTNIYIDGVNLQNNVLSYIKYNCQTTSLEYNTAKNVVFLIGTALDGIEQMGSDRYVHIVVAANTTIQANDAHIFFVELEAFIDDTTKAPTPSAIAVTKIQGNSVTITYTRG